MKTNIRRLGFDIDFLAQEEIKRLPRKLFKSKTTTFCDFSIGGGQFLRAIIAELKKYGHSDENIKGRIYGFESNRFYLNAGSFDLLGNFYVDKDQSFDVIKHMKFDVIVGNSPYQKQVGPNKTEAIWDKFIFKSFEHLKKDGYLVLIHPSGWRNVSGRFLVVKNILLSKQMEYLEIHNEKDGLRTFGANTRYDWYILKNSDRTKNYKTCVRFEDGSVEQIDLCQLPFIPNHSFDRIKSLIATEGEERVTVLHSQSAYETRKPYINKTKTKKFKYPLISRVRVGLDFDEYWSSTNQNGHFDIPKLVFSLEGATGAYLDIDGTYGLTQFSWAIVDDVENLTQMKKVFDSSVFRELMTATTLKGNVFNYKIIALFRKDFWKDFL